MKPYYLRQCELKRENTTRVAWIPEKYAKQGKTIKLKINGEWVDGWFVAVVYDGRMASDEEISCKYTKLRDDKRTSN